MALGLYDAAFATAGTLLGREAGPVITGITLLAGFASTVFWSLGAALVGPLGWRGLLLAYAALMLAVNLPMVWLLVPGRHRIGRAASAGAAGAGGGSTGWRWSASAAFFTLRWFITSAIAVHVLTLLQGIGLEKAAAVAVAALIGPGQVLGRIARVDRRQPDRPAHPRTPGRAAVPARAPRRCWPAVRWRPRRSRCSTA